MSHAHIDHLHLPSLRLIDRGVPIVVPRGAGRLVERAGFTTVIEVVAGDHIDVGGVAVEVVHAEHRRGRGPHSRVDAAPVGYVFEIDGLRTYFAGDTDLFDDMSGFERVDVALVPIWGWGPTIGSGHLDPGRAANAVQRIDPQVVVPIHWGTYAPEDLRDVPGWFDEPADRFERALDAAGMGDRLIRLDPGDTVTVTAGRARAIGGDAP